MRNQIRREQSQLLATLLCQWRRMSYPTAILCVLWHSLNSKGVDRVSTNKLSLSRGQMSDWLTR